MKKILICLIVAASLVLCIGCEVLVDKTTRVMYFYTTRQYSNTMTVLLDSDGKPRLYEEE